MVTPDLNTLMTRLGITRILGIISNCICFSLMASVGVYNFSFWTWCLFTWSFSFCTTLLILILELFSLNQRLPISWNDFTAAFSIVATLMVFATSVIMSVFFAKFGYAKFIAATAISFFSFGLHCNEITYIWKQSDEISGFLSSIPGLLKIIEAFVACVIFICLDFSPYPFYPGLQWCVAVYSICFIFAMFFIITTIGRLQSWLPVPIDKVMLVCNVLAVVMYMTAVIIWPVYSFRNISSSDCPTVAFCPRKLIIVITFMTCFNFVAYVVDLVYSLRQHFFSQS
ncbi:myeloid-associated differentiation marker-like [Oryzias latipes]|uniref:MARVEL domain-containing protein n=1 Tax=Oryzias latipes TaxID=8090 RepID=H2M3U7_ORYLA|nr:myeloid-associated differentiation marker-like [Oryzias latipes]